MLSSKVALVTGGARGIGLAAVRIFLRNGAKVSFVDVSEREGETICKQLQDEFTKDKVMFLCCDVSKSEELRSVFERTKTAFGRLDVVCNNAGIGDERNWKKMIDINLNAVIEGTYLGLQHMSVRKGGQGGAIINVASFGGLVPGPGSPVYVATKHGVVGFTRSMLMKEHRDSVRVNCICPEFVNTRMVTDSLDSANEVSKQFILSKGLIEPETVAKGILELATDATKAGRVMTVTNKDGIRYARLFGDAKL